MEQTSPELLLVWLLW